MKAQADRLLRIVPIGLDARSRLILEECAAAEPRWQLQEEPDGARIILLRLSSGDGRWRNWLPKITRELPRARVLCLADDLRREDLCELIDGKIAGILSLPLHGTELIQAIRALEVRGGYLSPKAGGVSEFNEKRNVAAHDVTAREREVLNLHEQRLHQKEIAHVLGISPHTVRNHLANARAKKRDNGAKTGK